MSDYQQKNNYDSFDGVSVQRRRPGLLAAILGPVLVSKFRSPVFATVALLLGGAVFAGILMMGYSGSVDETQVPVIRADDTAYKNVPDDAGGMNVPHSDSTIFGAMRGEGGEGAKIENLLSDMPDDAAVADVRSLINDVESMGGAPVSAAEEQASATVVADAANPALTAEKPKELLPAGSSPETIEYARSMLEVQDEGDVVSAPDSELTPPEPEAAPVAPASAPASTAEKPVVSAPKVEEKKAEPPTQAVTETPKAEVKPEPQSATVVIENGSYYVQIASVKDEAAGKAEWPKLQKKYPVLSSLSYRVNRVDLGAKGVFYRIQAGGLSQASAGSVCAKIKEQTPGGCFVTK